MADHTDGLTYFTHEINGRLYAGWYRRRAGGSLEVFTRTKVRIEYLGKLSIEEHARRMLVELVSADDFAAERDSPQRQAVPSKRKK